MLTQKLLCLQDFAGLFCVICVYMFIFLSVYTIALTISVILGNLYLNTHPQVDLQVPFS